MNQDIQERLVLLARRMGEVTGYPLWQPGAAALAAMGFSELEIAQVPENCLVAPLPVEKNADFSSLKRGLSDPYNPKDHELGAPGRARDTIVLIHSCRPFEYHNDSFEDAMAAAEDELNSIKDRHERNRARRAIEQEHTVTIHNSFPRIVYEAQRSGQPRRFMMIHHHDMDHLATTIENFAPALANNTLNRKDCAGPQCFGILALSYLWEAPYAQILKILSPALTPPDQMQLSFASYDDRQTLKQIVAGLAEQAGHSGKPDAALEILKRVLPISRQQIEKMEEQFKYDFNYPQLPTGPSEFLAQEMEITKTGLAMVLLEGERGYYTHAKISVYSVAFSCRTKEQAALLRQYAVRGLEHVAKQDAEFQGADEAAVSWSENAIAYKRPRFKTIRGVYRLGDEYVCVEDDTRVVISQKLSLADVLHLYEGMKHLIEPSLATAQSMDLARKTEYRGWPLYCSHEHRSVYEPRAANFADPAMRRGQGYAGTDAAIALQMMNDIADSYATGAYEQDVLARQIASLAWRTLNHDCTPQIEGDAETFAGLSPVLRLNYAQSGQQADITDLLAGRVVEIVQRMTGREIKAGNISETLTEAANAVMGVKIAEDAKHTKEGIAEIKEKSEQWHRDMDDERIRLGMDHMQYLGHKINRSYQEGLVEILGKLLEEQGGSLDESLPSLQSSLAEFGGAEDEILERPFTFHIDDGYKYEPYTYNTRNGSHSLAEPHLPLPAELQEIMDKARAEGRHYEERPDIALIASRFVTADGAEIIPPQPREPS